jgi:uncharacterized protein
MELAQETIDEFVGVAHGDAVRFNELLQQHPGLVNARASWQETAIQAAAQTGQIEIAETLLKAGAPLDICTAAMLGQADEVAAMLEQDPAQSHASGAHGIPVLYYPSIRGHLEIAEQLLSAGAEVDAGAGGNTPLHGAVLFRQLQMVRWLLAHGADPSLEDYNGKTAYALAVDNGLADIAAEMRAHGVAA